MYKEYVEYCDEGGKLPVNKQAFPRKLAELAYTKKETAKGNVWVG